MWIHDAGELSFAWSWVAQGQYKAKVFGTTTLFDRIGSKGAILLYDDCRFPKFNSSLKFFLITTCYQIARIILS